MAKIHRYDAELVAFHCPGCNEAHGVRVSGIIPVWMWNESLDKPTFAPSVLIRSGHYLPDRNSPDCWCTYNAVHPDSPAPFICVVCHSFVVDGKIQFLGDCTHSLKGQTVELPEWG